MKDPELREILAQEYAKAGFGESRIREIRGNGILPDRTQAALNAMRRIPGQIIDECVAEALKHNSAVEVVNALTELK